MTFEGLTPVDLAQIPPGNTFLQSPLWGKFRSGQGWIARGFQVRFSTGEVPLLVLQRSLGLAGTLAYVPHGFDGLLPGDSPETSKLVSQVGKALKSFLPKNLLTIRWDLTSGTTYNLDSEEPETFPVRLPSPLVKTIDVQPPDTVLLDITPDQETLLKGMHKKTRYNIGLAEKKGVVVRKTGKEELDSWYDLYEITSQRDKIAIHPRSYYRGLFETADHFPGSPVELWLAEHDGQVLAGIITLLWGQRCTYLYGASSNEGRNLMPAYLLQWKAILDAKERGCTEYDFFGIPPTGEEGHPMHGLYRFKTGFGGIIHHRHGAYDQVFRPWVYFFTNQAEKLRTWYYKVWKKR